MLALLYIKYYEFHIKDHLGNTRVVFRKNTSGNTVVLQKDDYYPGGLLIKERMDTASNKNKYLYNSIEFLSDLNLNYYDYGARFYDPQLGRWNRKDPLMEWHFNYSPYAYCFDNPVSYIDPDGMDASSGVLNDWNGDIARKLNPKPPKVDPIFPGYPIPEITVTGYTKAPWCKRIWRKIVNSWNNNEIANGIPWTMEGGQGQETTTAKHYENGEDITGMDFIRPQAGPHINSERDLAEAIKYFGKAIKELKKLITSDKDILKENTGNTPPLNSRCEEIDEQGQPKNRVEHGYTPDFKHKTILENRDDSIILKVVNYPGDTNIYKALYPKNK
jgi:RHS repeat-associated protein